MHCKKVTYHLVKTIKNIREADGMAWHFEGGRLQKDAEFIHRVALFN